MYRQAAQDITWRLIDTGPLSGAENMALDEALLEQFDPTSSLPILRLYGWQPAALSLGRFQKAAEELDLEEIEQLQLPVVRRITGGGAIYHADELTYSIVCSPQQIPLTASIKDSFRVLTTFLLDFYQQLGLDAVFAHDAPTADRPLGGRSPLCFAGTESYDILINGRKIGGNAQRRLRQVIFQHGSLPVGLNLEAGLACLRVKPVGLNETVTCLTQQGVDKGEEQLKQVLADCFSQRLGVHLEPGGLTADEQQGFTGLLRDKYTSRRWNLAGEAE
jgi:lipoyl(octanoyl) transferase